MLLFSYNPVFVKEENREYNLVEMGEVNARY
jgi:hypothetical protein